MKAIVVHSGGMDSSICLKIAIQKYGEGNVLSLSFSYGQRHSIELVQAEKISKDFKVRHKVLNLDCLNEITESALLNPDSKIVSGNPPNTMVVGRNGLMARVAAIHAHALGAQEIYMGIMELEGANSGYRDCSRAYMDIIEAALKIDFADPEFKIQTPLVLMSKKQTMEKAFELGVLSYLLEETITCYEGIPKMGCRTCPACHLRNSGLKEFLKDHPSLEFSYKNQLK